MPVPLPGNGTMEGIAEGFQPMPAGVYPAEVSDMTEETAGADAKFPGSTYLKWEFTITDEEYAGNRAWTNTSITEKALPIYRQTLKGIGFTDEEIDAMNATVDRDEVLGRPCRIVLKVGVNPKTKQANNSIVRVLPFDDLESGSELPG